MSKLLEQKLLADRRLECFVFMRNNALDICKLAAGDNEERAQAARNLVYLSFEKWGWALLRNLERQGGQ